MTHRNLHNFQVLAAWSPVFKSMFTRDFKEKELREIELPGKHVDDFVELLHCMYPPIKPVTGKGIVTLAHTMHWITRVSFKHLESMGLEEQLFKCMTGLKGFFLI